MVTEIFTAPEIALAALPKSQRRAAQAKFI
jgi:hypothetical protein